MTPEELAKRRAQNRRWAQASRARKKQRLGELEHRVKELESSLAVMSRSMAELHGENQKLKTVLSIVSTQLQRCVRAGEGWGRGGGGWCPDVLGEELKAVTLPCHHADGTLTPPHGMACLQPIGERERGPKGGRGTADAEGGAQPALPGADAAVGAPGAARVAGGGGAGDGGRRQASTAATVDRHARAAPAGAATVNAGQLTPTASLCLQWGGGGGPVHGSAVDGWHPWHVRDAHARAYVSAIRLGAAGWAASEQPRGCPGHGGPGHGGGAADGGRAGGGGQGRKGLREKYTCGEG